MQNADGSYFIDRNPRAFAAILSYLRTRQVFPNYEGVTRAEVACEAEYFGLAELSEELSGPSCHYHKEVLILAHGGGHGNQLFALKVPSDQRLYLSNVFDDQIGLLR